MRCEGKFTLTSLTEIDSELRCDEIFFLLFPSRLFFFGIVKKTNVDTHYGIM